MIMVMNRLLMLDLRKQGDLQVFCIYSFRNRQVFFRQHGSKIIHLISALIDTK